MIQDGLKNKENDIKGITKQACSLLDIAWTKGYVAGVNDGHRTCMEGMKRRKGSWIDSGDAMEEYKEWGHCSVCGGGMFQSDFCPNCGADMRGGQG